jgi:F-type H+-transporting ATPase subunit gamma
MQRLAELQARVQSLGELGDVVSALRAVSAARIQQTQAVLASIREYTTIIHDAVGEASRMLGELAGAAEAPARPRVVIAFGSEHGFVGSFNQRVLEVAAREGEPGGELLIVGSRAGRVALDRRVPVSWSGQMASQVGGVDDVALRVAERLSLDGGQRLGQRVSLVYTRLTEGSPAEIVTQDLLPFDPRPYQTSRPDRPRAVSYLGPRALLDGLIDELLLAQLAHAATESFASENAARLAAMQAAADNLAGKLEELRRQERELRQEEITMELLDVVTGARVVTGG